MPATATDPRRRGWVERVGIGLLLGVAVLSLGVVALLTTYLNRISDAAASMSRIDPLVAYSGRPSPVSVNGVNAVNFLLTSTTAGGELDGVVIAHLSASRRQLVLIAVPADLRPSGSQATIAARQAADPQLMVRDLEQLTGVPMDYQVHLDLDQVAPVVDVLGGVQLAGAERTGDEAVAVLSDTSTHDRSLATAELIRATLVQASRTSAIADPSRFDTILDALTPCLKLDANLTADEIQNTIVESKVHATEIAAVPLGIVRDGTASAPAAEALEVLRQAFASDDFTEVAGTALVPSSEPTR